VNGYVRHTRKGKHYVTKEALAFKSAIAVINQGRSAWNGKASCRYSVHVKVMLGKRQRLDVDNSPKCVLDALKDCGAIHSDAAVTALSVSMGRDALAPRTEIEVEAI
jgi:Holliday junction resolvase RusA-like endonuclease